MCIHLNNGNHEKTNSIFVFGPEGNWLATETEMKQKKSEIDVLISDTGEILATEEDSD